MEVRSFLGFSGYYRRFIEHYSCIAAPLYAVTGNVDFIWTEKCERAFNDLKKLIRIHSPSPSRTKLGFAISDII